MRETFEETMDFLVKPRKFFKLSVVDLLLIPWLVTMYTQFKYVGLITITCDLIIRLVGYNMFKDKYPKEEVLTLKTSLFLIALILIFAILKFK